MLTKAGASVVLKSHSLGVEIVTEAAHPVGRNFSKGDILVVLILAQVVSGREPVAIIAVALLAFFAHFIVVIEEPHFFARFVVESVFVVAHFDKPFGSDRFRQKHSVAVLLAVFRCLFFDKV